MKHFLSVMLLIVFITAPLISHSHCLSGRFVLCEEPLLRVSIDTGWERNGWVPVYFVFGQLTVNMRAHDPDASNGLENRINKLLAEDLNLPFQIYEHNPMRTRMMLADNHNSELIQLQLNRGRDEILIAGKRLNLEPLHIRVVEIKAGELFELRFAGPGVFTLKRFVFSRSTGIIYTAEPRIEPDTWEVDLNNDREWTVWAVRIQPGETIEQNRELEK